MLTSTRCLTLTCRENINFTYDFLFSPPYHGLPCIALTSQRNNTKQFPAWCLCPPLVYSGNAGACWDQSGQRRPHYCSTRRQAGGREPHQPSSSLVFRKAVVCAMQTELLYVFKGLLHSLHRNKLRGNHSGATDDTVRGIDGCFPASVKLFSSTGIIFVWVAILISYVTYHINGIHGYNKCLTGVKELRTFCRIRSSNIWHFMYDMLWP